MSTQHSALRNMSALCFETWHFAHAAPVLSHRRRRSWRAPAPRRRARPHHRTCRARPRGTPVVVPALSILRSGNTGANEHYSCATTTSLRIPRRGAQRGYRTLRAWLTSGSGARPRRRASSASSLRLAPCTTTSRAQWRMALWSTPSLPLPTLSEVRACLGA